MGYASVLGDSLCDPVLPVSLARRSARRVDRRGDRSARLVHRGRSAAAVGPRRDTVADSGGLHATATRGGRAAGGATTFAARRRAGAWRAQLLRDPPRNYARPGQKRDAA